ncbi:Gfo/Idh/MocA family protein [Kribbella sp. NPDC059898]|uniref:Gfo/Idh/MocA family protein n=1 Tax=Kribbella sp. NPDC059898 TaxID=3346995 RepID=UPI003653B692
MTTPVRVAVLGAGFFGGMLARAAFDHPDFEVLAVCDRDLAAAGRLADTVGAKAVDDLTMLAQDDVLDLVFVATPNHLHADHVIPLLAAGKHVFVEKPIAISAAAAEAMLDAARANHRSLLVGHILRTLPGVARVHAEVVAGGIGEVREAYGVRSRVVHVPADSADWWKLDQARSGGEMLHELHELDLIAWFLGEPETVVTLGGDSVHRTTMSFASGAVAHHELSTTGHAAAWGFRVTGSEAALEVDFRAAEVRRYVDGTVTESWGVLDDTEANESLRAGAAGRQAYHSHNESTAPSPLWMATAVTHELHDVLRQLRGGHSLLVDAPDLAVRVGLAALESAAAGGRPTSPRRVATDAR